MKRIMNGVTCSMYIFILYLLHLQLIAIADNVSYVPSENIVLNCGSNTSKLVQNDGRYWNGDIASPYVSSNANTKSLIARAPNTLQYIPEVPYMTARIFRSQFTYKFNVTSGPKFIRLHFHPASYTDLNISNAFLSVSAGNFTLLHNFSVSLNADYFNLSYFMKEFIVYVSGSTLELTFTPSYNDSDAYAFVNGIEVVSMPLDLYICGDDAPLPLVGHDPKIVYIYNDSAMENLYRLTVGGEQISPKYDTGMFRTWDTDEHYIFGANIGIQPSNMAMPVLFANNAPTYTAPEDVYRTSRSMGPLGSGIVNLNYNQTWFFPVDSGFNYLVRLHFCEVDYDITKVNEVVFSVFLNNQTAETYVDPIAMGGGPGFAIHRDYVVMVPQINEGKQDLWLDLHPNKDSKPMYYNAYVNGVEIFKLSTFDEKNLAGLNPSPRNSKSSVIVKAPHVAKFNKKKKFTIILTGCGFFAVALSILLYFVPHRSKVIRCRRIMSWCGLALHIPNQIEKAKKSSFCCHFSMKEIKVATNDFDEALLIGTGGFGSVYKGSFDGGATFVAIKRANPMSEQGASEFEAEVLLLSKHRHNNLISLLGYCNEEGEMILVYDFMANGTLYGHLHMRQGDQPPLTWIQRLEICIGVAKGLHYLHTGTKHSIIHRDIKTTNILLDHNWVPKISDFGLSKASYPSIITTNVKGSIGYLDPEYYQCHKLTEKSDLYSLGVVLLEVLSARLAVSQGEDDEQVNLAEWVMSCFENGSVEQIMDPSIEGSIVKECFELYLGVAMKCVAESGVERPSIGEVLQSLVQAMHCQKNASTTQDVNVNRNYNSGLQGNSDLTPGVEFSDIMMPIGR
ncbi:receptor-like protein kinase FERONIA [Abrus precatorius]|uniref:Receptor-like protein kinase FERONIA n=1 Tax=Abrus precatorius TaxID=3816 RepID=A0A8B8LYZ0_ABRPR|nr:receptor-like protein kinase FERONIA [Abrus precatorius]